METITFSFYRRSGFVFQENFFFHNQIWDTNRLNFNSIFVVSIFNNSISYISWSKKIVILKYFKACFQLVLFVVVIVVVVIAIDQSSFYFRLFKIDLFFFLSFRYICILIAREKESYLFLYVLEYNNNNNNKKISRGFKYFIPSYVVVVVVFSLFNRIYILVRKKKVWKILFELDVIFLVVVLVVVGFCSSQLWLRNLKR